MTWLAWFTGTGFIALAILAYQLGIDHTPDWGTSRWAMLAFGVVFVLLGTGLRWKQPFSAWIASTSMSRQWHSFLGHIKRSSIFQRISGFQIVRWFTQPSIPSAITITVIIVLLGWITAWWLVTAGHMMEFPTTSAYFDRLADAFLHGQLSLLETPDPRLAALPNPYDYQSRIEIPVLWDATYFQGKYFLYWGPVPSLIACVVKWRHPAPVGDLSLTFAFVLVIMAVQAWVITLGYRLWFSHLTAGLVLPPLITATFSAPLLWLLPRPSVYEAAIAGGQFFWLIGLACTLKGLNTNSNKAAWLFAAGLAWAAAVGCRATLALPIGAVCAGLFVVFLLKPETRRALITAAFAFSLGMSGLAWYNAARFGSVFETGYSYQLTGPAAFSIVDGQIYSTTYILPNLYNNFFRPPQIDGEFPFILAPWITESNWPFFIHPPKLYYYSEPITGLLFICSFIFFLPAIFRRRSCPEALILLAGAAASILASLAFIASFMRYLLDFSPALIFLATLGFWHTTETPSNGWITVGFILAASSASFGILLGLSGPTNNFLNNNPTLFQWLAQLMGG